MRERTIDMAWLNDKPTAPRIKQTEAEARAKAQVAHIEAQRPLGGGLSEQDRAEIASRVRGGDRGLQRGALNVRGGNRHS